LPMGIVEEFFESKGQSKGEFVVFDDDGCARRLKAAGIMHLMIGCSVWIREPV
jgi:hypothetical protein